MTEIAARSTREKPQVKTVWWEREDLRYRNSVLYLGEQNLYELAQAAGTPLYVYNGNRVRDNFVRLQQVLESRALDYRIFFAMKGNRYLPLLTYLKTTGLCGLDVCSPQELLRGRQCGFRENEISFTAPSLSNEDLDCLSRHPQVLINCDSLSTIRRLGERCPGRAIGIRINPGLGTGYRSNQLFRYSGSKTTKFGIYREQFDQALQLAKDYNLRVTGIHFHTGNAYLTPQLKIWSQIMETCLWFIDCIPNLTYVNIGGGLGIPFIQEDEPLDLEMWADIVAKHLGNRNLQIHLEPGTYVVKDAGVLVLKVNTVEDKEQTRFIGVNGGFNILVEPAFYKLPLEVVPVQIENTESLLLDERTNVTIAGNINEALDILAENVELPPVREGDYLCFLNAGGYCASMSSNHCMRGNFAEYLILD